MGRFDCILNFLNGLSNCSDSLGFFLFFFHVVSIVLMTNVTVIWMYLYTAQDNKILYQD